MMIIIVCCDVNLILDLRIIFDGNLFCEEIFNFWKLYHILLFLSLEISMNFLEIALWILNEFIIFINNTLKNVIQIL